MVTASVLKLLFTLTKKERKMKNSHWAWSIGLAAVFFLIHPSLVPAEEQSAKSPCEDIADQDDRHLCLATIKDADQDSSKNHSSYYCSLVKSRDKQNYCYAITNKTSSMCSSIVDKKLEDKCKASF